MMVTQDEHVGFGQTATPFGYVCDYVPADHSLPKLSGDALGTVFQFYKLFGDDWSVTLERDKREHMLVPLIPNAMDPDHFITESMLMIWHGLASWLIERRLPLERVHFSYPRPAHADEYDALFFAPVMQFDMPRTEITFAADYLDLPIRR